MDRNQGGLEMLWNAGCQPHFEQRFSVDSQLEDQFIEAGSCGLRHLAQLTADLKAETAPPTGTLERGYRMDMGWI
jgi:hypothetical protein